MDSTEELVISQIDSWLNHISWERIVTAAVALSLIAFLRFISEHGQEITKSLEERSAPASRRITTFEKNVIAWFKRSVHSEMADSSGQVQPDYRQATPFMNRKQLIVSLFAATWISIVALTLGTGQFLDFFLRSLPALTFGAVLYLWFGKSH
jgi:hypothetical protein